MLPGQQTALALPPADIALGARDCAMLLLGFGAALPDLMRQTRRKSTRVGLACFRPADLWRNNVTQMVFAAEARKGEE